LLALSDYTTVEIVCTVADGRVFTVLGGSIALPLLGSLGTKSSRSSTRSLPPKFSYCLPSDVKEDGKPIWKVKLTSKPKLDRLVNVRDGSLIVGFDDRSPTVFAKNE